MVSKYLCVAKFMILIEIFLLFVTIFCYFWLKNVLVGAFFILYVVVVITGAIGLFFSIVLLLKFKKKVKKTFKTFALKQDIF